MFPMFTVTFEFAIFKAPEMPSVYMAHVKGLDLLTQGDSISDAVAMLVEAITLVIEENSRQWPPYQYQETSEEILGYYKDPELHGNIKLAIMYKRDEKALTPSTVTVVPELDFPAFAHAG